MAVAYIDGTDVETWGFEVVGLQGHADGVELPRDYVPIPGSRGGILAAKAAVPPRTIVMDLLYPGSTVANRRSAFRDLEARCGEGLVELKFGDASAEYVEGRLVRAAKQPGVDGPWFTDSAADMIVQLEFLCPQPVYWSTSEFTINLSTTAADIALGTLPSAGTITVNADTNTVTDPVVTYADSGGTTVETMSFTDTIAVGDQIDIDLDNWRITKTESGVEAAEYDLLTSGDFFFPDPADGVYTSTAWPTITLSATSGTVTGTYTYRKAYRS